MDARKLFLLQTLNMRWNFLYLSIVTTEGKFLDEIEPYVHNIEILNQLNLKEKSESLTPKEKVLLLLRDDTKCWAFVKQHLKEIKKIKDWSYYRRAAKAGSDIIVIERKRKLDNLFKQLDEMTASQAADIWKDAETFAHSTLYDDIKK